MENHLKKRKKPEKKLAQDFPGYVGYKDVAYLTEYVTGSDNKSAIENMRNSTAIGGSSKEMNVKKKDKKELNGLKEKKKNGREIVGSSSAGNGGATGQSEKTEPTSNATSSPVGDGSNAQVSNDLTNDKNNNLTAAASSTEIIPNSSSTDHSSAASSDLTVRKESSELSSGKPVAKDSSGSGAVHGENNANNPNSQPARGNNKPTGNSADKPEKNKASSSASNQSRKSSANLEISNNDRQQSNQSANSNQSSGQRSAGASSAASKEDQPVKITSIVSNGLHGLDSMYIVSDSEVPDQEGDFKIVKYKQLRRKKQKKGSNQEEHIRLTGYSNELPNSGQSGRGPASKRERQRDSQNPATARGYESESDYCAVEGRKRGLQRNEMQRDAVLLDNSGGSISNSDSDSINSSNEEAATNRLTNNLMNSADPTPFESAGHFAPSTLSNNHVPYSKISYAAITKMHYSNPTSNGAPAMNSSNLTSNANLATTSNQPAASSQQALETRRESLNDKKNSKNPTNDKNKATQKSITNSAESPKTDEQPSTKSKELGGKPDSRRTPDDRKQSQDRQPQDKPQQPQQPKRLAKADSAEAERTADRASTTELELSTTDHSRTDSIDLNHPSYLSSKSSSMNSTQQPPVIMLDNKSTDQDTPFTFGFFNENAQFQNNPADEESDEPSQPFSPAADVNMVNFISKESAASQRQPTIKTEAPNNAENEKSDEDEQRAVREEPAGKPRSPKSEASVSNSINLDAIMNSSPVGNQPAPSGFGGTLNSNTPICAGTYIMESSEDYSAHDNITKKVGHDAKSSGDQRRSTHINDLVSSCTEFDYPLASCASRAN